MNQHMAVATWVLSFIFHPSALQKRRHVMLTRETKVGLVVAGSFLCLVAVVVLARLRNGDTSKPEEHAQAGSPKTAEPAAPSSGSPTEAEPSKPVPTATMPTLQR